jgi:WD repeat-containing protein 22
MNVEMSGVQYHPSMDNLFVSSNSKGQVYLHDTRMAFESDDDEATRGQKGIVQKYTHIIGKSHSSRMSNPEASSISFDKEGA